MGNGLASLLVPYAGNDNTDGYGACTGRVRSVSGRRCAGSAWCVTSVVAQAVYTFVYARAGLLRRNAELIQT